VDACKGPAASLETCSTLLVSAWTIDGGRSLGAGGVLAGGVESLTPGVVAKPAQSGCAHESAPHNTSTSGSDDLTTWKLRHPVGASIRGGRQAGYWQDS
jgi:hypothetical protein